MTSTTPTVPAMTRPSRSAPRPPSPVPALAHLMIWGGAAAVLALARLRPGPRVLAEGPYGGFTARRRRTRKTLLLGGGVGITPLRTLFETLPGEVTLVYRARRPEDLALRGELDAVAAARGAAVHYVVDEPAVYSSPPSLPPPRGPREPERSAPRAAAASRCSPQRGRGSRPDVSV
ncbi:hypothetical protein GCM10010390_79970 [Streptomyces mordarskii]|uniref:Oxidoreductase FAD/NAD(P)-binding domain-containing protein n=1 Tax=Streptomyces mordarskii TaxID=1226758 RepID=A0ABN1EGC9_9ACTN